MCGIVGQILPSGESAQRVVPSMGEALDALAHRGPDGNGRWFEQNVALGHTRLAVRDPQADAAAQPMRTPCGRYALVFNGELYDDARWRAQLDDDVKRLTNGRGFQTTCDAETLLWALRIRGISVLDRVRGMYALAFVDLDRRRAWLARDPMGVKPLFLRHGTERVDGGAVGIQFASETKALCRLIGGAPELDPEGVSAYLATSRRTAFGRTLFAGIRTVEPGDVLRIDLDAREPRAQLVASGARFRGAVEHVDDSEALIDDCRTVIETATESHLASDVPLCALLSGGLDSAIITRAAMAQLGSLKTWCATGVDAARASEPGSDAEHAHAYAGELGTDHALVEVDKQAFLREWRAHVQHLEQPLATPNEVAIAEISRAIRGAGSVVTLSGEGADELFGGYDAALAAFDAFHVAGASTPLSPGRFHLEATSWIAPEVQAEILTPALAGAHAWTVDAFERAFVHETEAVGHLGVPVEAHLRLQRRLNLTALLERLDAATMRSSVEGRTPFADVAVARFADASGIRQKFIRGEQGAAHRTKIILRKAFEHVLPASIVHRPKASFPLPFERWSVELAAQEALRSEVLRTIVKPEIIDMFAQSPAQNWRLAWLFGNLALFAEAAYGVPAARVAA